MFIQRYGICSSAVCRLPEPTKESERLRHRLIATVTERIESFKQILQ